MIRFVTGIDTGIGKTVAVGLWAKYLADQNQSVITQKIVQTGSQKPAEDIVVHRKLMEIPLVPEDVSGLTCPYIFPVPASPHLAARLSGQEIEPARITEATESLARIYDNLLIEGVGGLHVPLNDSVTVLDYLAERKYPTILVTSSRLGSINHTLMSMELLRSRSVPLLGLIYNRFENEDERIVADSRTTFERYLERFQFPDTIVDLCRVGNEGAQGREGERVFGEAMAGAFGE
ncbi:MAG: dethiobiotin synthase [Kiritimatiellia bacterium]|jgi:dethiobiotin synthetase|nr:dethiobiotin synthase [Kiritimatiellia bacterium]